LTVEKNYEDFLANRLQSWPTQYAFALIAVAVAAVLRYGLVVAIGFSNSFILFFPTILVVALLAGFYPGILATLLSAVFADGFFIATEHALTVDYPRDLITLLLFVFVGVTITSVAHATRRHEARLREFEQAIEGLEEMIVVVDRNYRYLIANRAFLSYRGMKRTDLLGRHVADVLNPGVFENKLKPKVDECFDGNIVQFEMSYQYAERGERELLITYIPVRGRKGVDRIACILQDITDQKQSGRSLRLFRALIDESNDAIEVIDPITFRFLDVNEKSCKDLGFTRAELLARSVFDVVVTPDESGWHQVVQDLKEQRAFLQQMVHRRKDGLEFPVETSFKYVELDRGYIIAVSRDISERVKAEAALRESEDRYRDLVENSQDLVCTHDLSGRLLSVNVAAARALGYRVDELLAAPMQQFLAPRFQDQFTTYLERMRSARADQGLLCLVTRAGKQRIWEYSNTLRTEGVPQPIVRGMAHDVTEQKLAEQARLTAESALRAREQHFRILVEQATDGIFVTDGQGRYLDVNTAGAQMLGYSREEILRLSIGDVVAKDEIDRISPEIMRFAAGSVIRSEWIMRRKDGSFFPAELCGKQLPDGRLQGILRDITERKQAEVEMRRSEERFRVALKDSPITVFNQDNELRYTWAYNPQLYWQHDLIGKTDEEILGTKKASGLTNLKRKVLRTGLPVREEVVVPSNGKRFAFDASLEPLFDAEGKVVGITGACVDIAKLRELADRLQASTDRLEEEKVYLEKEIRTELGFADIIGESPALGEVLKKVRVVAPTDSTVLLLGETGTGKELIARSLHSLSSRQEKTFVKLNCAAVPSGLLESELFGHEKGAFTGAVTQKVGRIELADKGTLFLDEIGELPLELQPKLLRVLQDREFERLGSVRTLRVDVRIISATNRDLEQDVAAGDFREDLYYRLHVFPIHLPPLRERKEDIPILARHFMKKHAARMGKQVDIIPDETIRILKAWNWPGNIRELENMIERMIILSNGRTLVAPPAELNAEDRPTADDLGEMEREHIIRVLRETNGVLSGASGAAVRLGLKRTTLQSMLKRFGIEADDFRRGD